MGTKISFSILEWEVATIVRQACFSLSYNSPEQYLQYSRGFISLGSSIFHNSCAVLHNNGCPLGTIRGSAWTEEGNYSARRTGCFLFRLSPHCHAFSCLFYYLRLLAEIEELLRKGQVKPVGMRGKRGGWICNGIDGFVNKCIFTTS